MIISIGPDEVAILSPRPPARTRIVAYRALLVRRLVSTAMALAGILLENVSSGDHVTVSRSRTVLLTVHQNFITIARTQLLGPRISIYISGGVRWRLYIE